MTVPVYERGRKLTLICASASAWLVFRAFVGHAPTRNPVQYCG